MTTFLPDVDLRERSSWDPAAVLAPDPTSYWPAESVEPLADVAVRLLPQTALDRPVVRQIDVDPDTGRINLHPSDPRGYAFHVGSDGLDEGDLLISSRRPTIFVTRDFTAMQFSTTFLAIRPKDRHTALWLWSALNTSAGTAARYAPSSSPSMRGIAQLRVSDLYVPCRPQTWGGEQEAEALTLINAIAGNVSQQDVGQSWWRVTELSGDQSWGPLLSTPDVGLLTEGEPLSEYLVGVRTGRRPREVQETTSEDLLPVWGVPQLRGAAPTAFAAESGSVTANPGDVLVQRVGLKGTAAEATERCIADGSVLVLNLRDPGQAQDVVLALNSPAGQRQRAMHSAGVAVPSISSRSLGEMRIVPEAGGEDAHPTMGPAVLRERLDRLVWS